jgi:predicted nucleic acid-binding protein
LIAYPDSSFLASGYLLDGHSREVARRMASHPSVLVTPFHRAEVANAIYQQVFRNHISLSEAKIAYSTFERDCAAGIWMLADFPGMTYDSSIELTQRQGATLGVRTLDTLHVAAALELKADRFWTFDERQARLAEAEGLATT